MNTNRVKLGGKNGPLPKDRSIATYVCPRTKKPVPHKSWTRYYQVPTIAEKLRCKVSRPLRGINLALPGWSHLRLVLINFDRDYKRRPLRAMRQVTLKPDQFYSNSHYCNIEELNK